MKKYRVIIKREDRYTVKAVSKKDAITQALKSFRRDIPFNAEHYPDNLLHFDILDVKEIKVIE